MGFVTGPVSVSVPATAANLGPGFDSLGLALDLRDELTAEVTGSGLAIEVTGSGADDVPLGEDHLVVRSMRAAFAEMGEQPAGLRLVCTNRIPHGRGLGSSSAAIVAGVGLARALVAGGMLLMDDGAAFDLAARLEGHPDNVAPAFYGGFTIAWEDDEGRFHALRSGVDPRVCPVVFIPPTPLATTAARGLLPASVPHADAAANAGRAALLIKALGHHPEFLLRATEDFLHQRYREPAMPESVALVAALRAKQVAAVISGAGPTVLAFTHEGEDLSAWCPLGWQLRRLAQASDGLLVTP